MSEIKNVGNSYNVGDSVFVIFNNDIKLAFIDSISISIDMVDMKVVYVLHFLNENLDRVVFERHDKHVFKTLEDVFDYFRNKFITKDDESNLI